MSRTVRPLSSALSSRACIANARTICAALLASFVWFTATLAQAQTAPAAGSATYIDPKLPVLVTLVVFSAMVYWMIQVAKRIPNLYIRPLAGIAAIEEAVGRATEMGRPVIYIPGVDDINNIQTIYSMMILEKVATMVAKYGTPLLVPT